MSSDQRVFEPTWIAYWYRDVPGASGIQRAYLQKARKRALPVSLIAVLIGSIGPTVSPS